MHRCIELAQLGNGHVAPNPVVGAVLVHEDRIIGEGYHKQFGGPHAEVNCIASVRDEDRSLIPQSTLYVSLEPCAHFGKTPPCADLIIQNKIQKVVVGCRDPFLQVNGKGIEKMQAAGIEVITGVLEEECITTNQSFFTFHTLHRPYVVLKWAQTGDGKIAGHDDSRLLISNAYTNRLVHRWRTESMAILVGTQTALLDNPVLTSRLWPGKSPLRLAIDLELRLPASLNLLNGEQPTIVFNLHKHTLADQSWNDDEKSGVHYYQVAEDASLVHQVMNALYQMKIQSLIVEGGAMMLQSFIDEGVWDEARVITNQQLIIGKGLPAPVLKEQVLSGSETIISDHIAYYKHQK